MRNLKDLKLGGIRHHCGRVSGEPQGPEAAPLGCNDEGLWRRRRRGVPREEEMPSSAPG